MKKNEKKTRGKLQFSKKWKIAIFLGFFFHFFFIFFRFFFIFFSLFLFFYHFFIIFHHFCFQWCKNFPKNKKMQFSSSFFHFFIIFLSCLLPVVELMKNDEKWWKMIKNNKKWKKMKKKIIFFMFFSLFFHFFSFFFHFITFHHFCFQWCKNFPTNKKMQFSSSFFHFFSFFYYFLSFFIIFHHFLSFFINSTTGSKNDKKMIKKWKKRGKLQFSIFWIFFCTTGRKND